MKYQLRIIDTDTFGTEFESYLYFEFSTLFELIEFMKLSEEYSRSILEYQIREV